MESDKSKNFLLVSKEGELLKTPLSKPPKVEIHIHGAEMGQNTNGNNKDSMAVGGVEQDLGKHE